MIVTGVAVLISNIAAGVVILFMLLIAMNGYSESDSAWGDGAYILLALIVALVMGVGALFFVSFLIKRQLTPAVSLLIAIPVFSIVGIMIETVCSLIGVGVAEFVRLQF